MMLRGRLIRALTLYMVDILDILTNAAIVILEMESPYHHLKKVLSF